MLIKIKKILAKKILDSRGTPTLEVAVFSKNNVAEFSVPAGASKGEFEAKELRDGKKEFLGLGVNKAQRSVNEVIAPNLIGKNIFNQEKIDNLLINLDGSKNKRNLGANAILGVSVAILKLASKSYQLPIWKYISEKYNFKPKVPFLVMNLINGGKHANSPLAFQEYHIVLKADKPVYSSLNNAYIIFKNLKEAIKKLGIKAFGLGDEGGFVLPLEDNVRPILLLESSIKKSNLEVNKDVFLGLDVAASSFFKNNIYRFNSKKLNKQEMANYIIKIASQKKIFYLEDPLEENDFNGFHQIMNSLAKKKTLVVGDDLTVTNKDRIKIAIENKSINAVLIKPNQIGTVSETIGAIKMAKKSKLKIIVSHRSGETNDSFISDLAVGTGADGLKAGSICRGERLAKYNRLLNIEEELKK